MINEFEEKDNEAVTEIEDGNKDAESSDIEVNNNEEPEKVDSSNENDNMAEEKQVAEPSSEEGTDAEKAPSGDELNSEPVAEQQPKEVYAFRWNYYDQYIHDKSEDKASSVKVKKKADVKGTLIFVAIMMVAFALAFSILLSSLKFDDMAEWFADGPDAKISIEEIVEKGMPSSVAIFALKGTNTYSTGSGFVVNSNGYVVTNYHVVSNSTSITVMDSNRHEYAATLIDYDESDDFAVLYLEDCSLPAVKIGDSDSLKLGETVVSIGTPRSEDYVFSVTDGIVSGLNRNVSDQTMPMIQTNAPLNPGNSGGPLFDENGNVVGIVTSKLTFTNVQENGQNLPYEGVAFAIPINIIAQRVEDIIKADLGKPMLGITAVAVEQGKSYFFDGDRGVAYEYKEIEGKKYYVDSLGTTYALTEDMLNNEKNLILHAHVSGIAVTDVVKGLSSDGKLERGDIIYMVNNTTVTTNKDIKAVLDETKVGDTINVKVNRHEELYSFDIKLMTKGEMLSSRK